MKDFYNMKQGSSQKALIILMLGLLTVSAFFIRLDNFNNSQLRSIDEVVYVRMALQVLEQGPSGYHTIPYGKELAAAGQPLPDYFFQPVFQHPPVFTFLVALSMKLFGVTPVSAEYVSLLLSVLMIPLIYLLGKLVFDARVGILSSFFLWLDPVNIICSQKIWMDSTIAFFTLLTAFLFTVGLKRGNDWFFILSGVASGLAVNTKYTGIFITFVIILYCVIYQRDIFKNQKFQFSLVLPVILLIPWLYWNYSVYGIGSLLKHSDLVGVFNLAKIYTPVILPMATIILCLLLFIKYKRNEVCETESPCLKEDTKLISYFSVLVPIIFFAFVVPKQFANSLQFAYLPTTTWQQSFFSGEGPSFYFGRLLEFSFVYAFSFAAIFMFNPDEKPEVPFLRLSAITILLFFVFWGNFQSRYILSSLPFLIILGVQFGIKMYEKSLASKNHLVYWGGRFGLKLIFIFIILKSVYLNVMLSYPNNMCYF